MIPNPVSCTIFSAAGSSRKHRWHRCLRLRWLFGAAPPSSTNIGATRTKLGAAIGGGCETENASGYFPHLSTQVSLRTGILDALLGVGGHWSRILCHQFGGRLVLAGCLLLGAGFFIKIDKTGPCGKFHKTTNNLKYF